MPEHRLGAARLEPRMEREYVLYHQRTVVRRQALGAVRLCRLVAPDVEIRRVVEKLHQLVDQLELHLERLRVGETPVPPVERFEQRRVFAVRIEDGVLPGRSDAHRRVPERRNLRHEDDAELLADLDEAADGGRRHRALLPAPPGVPVGTERSPRFDDRVVIL